MKGEIMAHKIEFERRRYGKATFTWIFVDGKPVGDPIQKIRPSKADIEARLAEYQAA